MLVPHLSFWKNAKWVRGLTLRDEDEPGLEPAGLELAYADAPGMVMRWVHCESVLIKIVHGGGRYWLDMRGVACLQMAES